MSSCSRMLFSLGRVPIADGETPPPRRSSARGWCLASLLAISFLGCAQTATASPLVGTSAGTFDVNRLGAATYHMPLSLPPGLGGMTPSLSLDYNSRAGDLFMGPGWQLSGLSQISRCPSTYAQNGITMAVSLGSTDRFCLDGQQLVTSGTNGGVGAEYRTELESFSKVTSSGGTPGNPASFTVKTKSGLTITYSTVVTNVVNSTTYNYIWLEDSVTDTAGNSIAYTYTVSGGEYLPNTITYGGNAAAGITGNIIVSFTYGYRQGYVPTGYIDSLALNHPHILTRIDSKLGTTAVRHWELGYVTSDTTRTISPNPPDPPANPPPNNCPNCRTPGPEGTDTAPQGQTVTPIGHDIVVSLTECAGADETQCYAPTLFTWNGWLGSTTDQSNSPLPLPTAASTTFVGDANGDGIPDLISAQGLAGGVKLAVMPSGGAAQPSVTLGSGIPYPYYGTGDVNGDGKTDVVVAYNPSGGGNTVIQNFLSTGTSFALGASITSSLTAAQPLVGDFNGDGIADVLLYTWNNPNTSQMILQLCASTGVPNNGSCTLGTPYAFGYGGFASSFTPVVVDLNGDGVNDLIVLNTASPGIYIQTFLNNGHGQFPVTPSYNTALTTSTLPNVQTLFADVNGDGMTDIVLTSRSGATGTMNTFLSKGDGTYTAAITSTIALSNSDARHVITGDFDGDGLTDIAWVDAGTTPSLNLSLSNGNGFFSTATAVTLPVNFPSSHLDFTGDFNGDGVADFLSLTTSGGTRTTAAGAPYLRIVDIQDAFGAAISVNYQPLTNSSGYTDNGGGASGYPVAPSNGPQYVAYQTNISNPGNINRQTTYHYWDSRINLQGRGWTGFSELNITDTTTGGTTLQRIVDYNQVFPYTGTISWNRIIDTSTGALAENDTYAFTNQTTSFGSYFLYSNANQTQSYEISSGASVISNSSQLSNVTYDGYGNLKTSTETVYTGAIGATPTYSTKPATPTCHPTPPTGSSTG